MTTQNIKDLTAAIKANKNAVAVLKEEQRVLAQKMQAMDTKLLNSVLSLFMFKNNITGKGKYSIKLDAAVVFTIKGVSDDLKVAADLAIKAAKYVLAGMDTGNSINDVVHHLHIVEGRKIVAKLRDLGNEALLEVPVSKKATRTAPAFYAVPAKAPKAN